MFPTAISVEKSRFIGCRLRFSLNNRSFPLIRALGRTKTAKFGIDHTTEKRKIPAGVGAERDKSRPYAVRQMPINKGLQNFQSVFTGQQ